MKSKISPIMIWGFIIGSMTIGGFLGIYILGKGTGEYDYEFAFAIIGGSVIAFVIYLLMSKWNKKRKGNIPDIDERSVMLMQKYLMSVLYVVFFGSAAALLTLYFIGVHYIETGLLIVYMMGLLMLIGIGALVTKRL